MLRESCKGKLFGSIPKDCLDNMVCKCPHFTTMAGDPALCGTQMKFSPNALRGKGCYCRGHKAEPMKKGCVTETWFGGAKGVPDLVESASEWCSSKHVPEDKRVPNDFPFRGLYWMMNIKLSDVAFCPSRGEWDKETQTLRMTVWKDFVFRKTGAEKVHGLTKLVTWCSAGGPLVYKMRFSNNFTNAKITTNNGAYNQLIKFPMEELAETPDGEVKSSATGDVYSRPSFFFGVEAKFAQYYAVRIMEEGGRVNLANYKLMQKKEWYMGGTFVNYDGEDAGTVCSLPSSKPTEEVTVVA